MHKRLTGSADNPLLLAGPGVTLGVNEHGQYIVGATARGFGGQEAGSSIRIAKITSVAGLESNYIEAKLADFTSGSESLDDSAVKVALPPLLWEVEKPTSSVAGYTFEREPAYAVNDYIAVASVPQGTGVEVSDVQVVWQDVTVGRAWAVKLPICIDGIIHYQLTHGGSITST